MSSAQAAPQAAPVVVWWVRRDLRLTDNRSLALALELARARGGRVLPLFIFDRDILYELPAHDRRVAFLHQTLAQMASTLAARGGTLLVRYGHPAQVWGELLQRHPEICAVATGRDSEPYALTRDAHIQALLHAHGASFHGVWDHVLREPEAVLTHEGRTYRVFTPYKTSWLRTLPPDAFDAADSEPPAELLHPSTEAPQLPSLADMGFAPGAFTYPDAEVPDTLIRNYGHDRDYPGLRGTSRLGLHLRFGTVSVRALARRAQALSVTYLSELIWRDFYQMILHHFPYVATQPFKPEYDRIRWRDSPDDFARWCAGETGYPIVDAGMRELNSTGFMHNRVRMIVASFLTKHLLIDWRLGEAYFAQQLLDFELASNNGGWQWAAGTGVDAAPYFRIFSPSEQTKKFDPQLHYVRQWVPEFEQLHYPSPMVEHKFARERALSTYKAALQPS